MISLGPLRSREPAASGLMTMVPEMLVHWARAAASAPLVMVAVGWEQRVAWVAATGEEMVVSECIMAVGRNSEELDHGDLRTAVAPRTGRRSFWANIAAIDGIMLLKELVSRSV